MRDGGSMRERLRKSIRERVILSESVCVKERENVGQKG